jgi:hypothetical protein
MTVFYVRPLTGNDANAGTTPASAWQSLSAGATALRIAPGDEIRVEESGAATSAGNATWTSGSGLVTKAVASNATVSLCEDPWSVAAVGVSVSTDPSRKQGTVSSRFVLPPLLAAGRVAYQAIAPTDYSAYRQICFWVRSDLLLPAGTLQVSLCSDAAGTVVVNTATVAYTLAAGKWTPIVVNTGAALGASIQSVLLSTLLPIGASEVSVNLDDIFTSKAAGSADEITLRTLISKGASHEPWYPIRSVDGATIALDAGIDDGPAALSPIYAGTTALAATSVKQALALPPAFTRSTTGGTSAVDSPWGTLNESGSSTQPILITGGWDSATMLTQTSETLLDLVTGLGTGLTFNSKSYAKASKISVLHGRQGIEVLGQHLEIADCGAFCMGAGAGLAIGVTNFARDIRVRRGQVVGGSQALVSVTTGYVTFEDLLVVACSHATQQAIVCGTNGVAEFNVLRVFDAQGAMQTRATTLIRGGQNLRLRNTHDFDLVGSTPRITLTICDFIFGNGVEVVVSGSLASMEWRVNLQNRNLVPNNHLIMMEGGLITPDTVFFYSGNKSWLLTPGATYRTADSPMILPLGPLWKLKSPPAAAQSVSVRVYRSNANIKARLRIPAGQLCSMSGDLIASDSGAAGAWNLITIPITMTADGVIDAQLEVYTVDGLSGYSCWTDDLS